MNQIKERLQKDYNLAVVFFNDKDYESFFVHIRPSIELICKLIVLDTVGDNEDGHDVLDCEAAFRLAPYIGIHADDPGIHFGTLAYDYLAFRKYAALEFSVYPEVIRRYDLTFHISPC